MGNLQWQASVSFLGMQTQVSLSSPSVIEVWECRGVVGPEAEAFLTDSDGSEEHHVVLQHHHMMEVVQKD